MRTSTIAFLAAIAMPVLAAAPARAGDCYEGIGCSSTQYFSKPALKALGCQPLWEVRNRIYKDRGYCFKTQSAIEAFGNAGCSITNQAAVPLNTFERSNVGAIRSVEKAKGCHFGG